MQIDETTKLKCILHNFHCASDSSVSAFFADLQPDKEGTGFWFIFGREVPKKHVGVELFVDSNES